MVVPQPHPMQDITNLHQGHVRIGLKEYSRMIREILEREGHTDFNSVVNELITEQETRLGELTEVGYYHTNF